MLQRLPTVLRVKCKFSNNSLQGCIIHIIHNSDPFRPLLSTFCSSNTNLSIFPTNQVHSFLSLHTCTSPQPSLFTTSLQNCPHGLPDPQRQEQSLWCGLTASWITFAIKSCVYVSFTGLKADESCSSLFHIQGAFNLLTEWSVNFNISVEIIYFQ